MGKGTVNQEDRYKDIPDEYKGGHCYQNAYRWMMKYRKHHPDLLLCHGWVTGQAGVVKGIRYSHAWVESPNEKQIIDPSMNMKDPIVVWDFLYYHVAEINKDRIIKYTIQEAIEIGLREGNFGPWDDRFDE